MPIKTRIIGNDEFEAAQVKTVKGDRGVVAITKPLLVSVPAGRPFINSTFGAAMNQNVSFGGTPEGIHDGTDSVLWTGAAVSGTWDFADTTDPQAGSKHVSVTNAVNADTATFADGTETDMSGFTAITGQIQLVNSYDGTRHNIILQFCNNGSPVGTSIDLNDYIDTGLAAAYQGFVIPKADMGVETATVDVLTITILRSGGPTPDIFFDAMQIEQTGTPLVYTVEATSGTKFYIEKLVWNWVDVGTAGTAYTYDKIGAVGPLSNGFVINTRLTFQNTFTATIRQLSDLLTAGGVVDNKIDDGTDTWVSVGVNLFETAPIILDSRNQDKVTVTINDNLSGLISFTLFARGHEELV